MRRVVVSASSRALAPLVLLLSVLAAIWAGLFKVWHPVGNIGPLGARAISCTPGVPCYSTSPGWTILAAVAIGLVGVVVAVLLYRPRPTSG